MTASNGILVPPCQITMTYSSYTNTPWASLILIQQFLVLRVLIMSLSIIFFIAGNWFIPCIVGNAFIISTGTGKGNSADTVAQYKQLVWNDTFCLLTRCNTFSFVLAIIFVLWVLHSELQKIYAQSPLWLIINHRHRRYSLPNQVVQINNWWRETNTWFRREGGSCFA